MAIPKFEADLNIISKLVDEPNDEGGMSAQALKEEFDRAGLLIKEYINEILVPQANIDIDNAAEGIGGSDGMDGSTIVDGTVTAAKLAPNSVTADKIAEDAVTAEKIAPKAVSEEAFADASIPTRAYKQGSVGAVTLAQNSVTADKIAEGAVTGAKLANGAVSTDKVADASVTRTKLAQDALYSPGNRITTTTYNIAAADGGKTIWDAYSLRNNNVTVVLGTEVASNFPVGTEIAFARLYTTESFTIKTNGIRIVNFETGRIGNASAAIDIKLPEIGSMCAIKKFEVDSTAGDLWLVTGNVEVV